MKNLYPLVIIFTFIFFQFKDSRAFAQNDKTDYILSAALPVKVKRDTFIYKLTPNNYQPKQEKFDYIVIPVTFTNNSNDTLRYIGMSCSWWDIYKTDNPKTRILQPNDGCYKNGPIVINMAPHTLSTVNLTILFKKERDKNSSFRIGMILQKYVDEKQSVYLNKFQSNNVIWSNQVQLP